MFSVRRRDSAEPLLDRVPKVDEHGKPLGDLLMILPGLGRRSSTEIARVSQALHGALAQFGDAVVFAELNLDRNQLWVSVRPLTGIRAAVATAVRAELPDAKLIAHL